MESLATGPTLKDVLTALDYQDDKGLVTNGTSKNLNDGRVFVWEEVYDKFDIDAAYFHGNVPVVYFKEFESFTDERLRELHKSLWNHNRAPLLVAVLPDEVRIYSCFSPPLPPNSRESAKNSALIERVTLTAASLLAGKKEMMISRIREALSDYRRRAVVSGQFVLTQSQKFQRNRRVDSRLLHNLNIVRKELIKEGLDDSVANRLIGRSIFVRYLEDRGVFKKGDDSWFGAEFSFRGLLEESPEKAYEFFDEVFRRFNGDLFLIDGVELEQVKSSHLQKLGRFLNGDDMISRQMYFWAYDFKYIPIELISAIYETFLVGSQRESGSYYTPPQIVDFVLSEILPFGSNVRKIRILDPACGSGIFLIEAYRRLVTLHSRSQKNKSLTFETLRDLLEESIFGVDQSEEAIQVAIFSCYLALLDFVETDIISKQVSLPKLRGKNMFVDDFFNLDGRFNEHSYDIIVGNPPWTRGLSELAEKYVKYNQHPIGRKQMAQAFLWRVPTLLSDKGQACLLCPSKSILYNQTSTEQEFRRRFFTDNQVTKVIDFSAFRHSLFKKSVAPMVAIFYQKLLEESDSDDLTYMGLHPSPLSEALAGVVVYGDEIKRLSRKRMTGHPYAWKVALWGTPRDLALIDDLRHRFPLLGDVEKTRNWLICEGFTGGNTSAKKPAPELKGFRYVPTEKIESFGISTDSNCIFKESKFHRPRDEKLYLGPHVLIRGGVRPGGFLSAVFLPDDAVFRSAVIGIAGPPEDKNHLKIVCAFINSSLARYYHFLTTSTWGVERGDVQLGEHRGFPCAIPDEDDKLFGEIVNLVDRAQQKDISEDWRPELDKLVYESYGLTSVEQQIVEDLILTKVERPSNRWNLNLFKKPLIDDLRFYVQAYKDVFIATTGGNIDLDPTIYDTDSAYRAVSFRLRSQVTPRRMGETIENGSNFEDFLKALETIALEQHGQDLYFLKNIKVYEDDKINIVKPAEQRFWTRSAAYNDADATIAELLHSNIKL